MLKLPQSVEEWLVSEGVDPLAVACAPTLRSFRAVVPADPSMLLEIAHTCSVDANHIKHIDWLPSPLHFYTLPVDAPLVQTLAYKDSRIQVAFILFAVP
jgi:hypothetical protein